MCIRLETLEGMAGIGSKEAKRKRLCLSRIMGMDDLCLLSICDDMKIIAMASRRIGRTSWLLFCGVLTRCAVLHTDRRRRKVEHVLRVVDETETFGLHKVVGADTALHFAAALKRQK